jgi:hypothetical protein
MCGTWPERSMTRSGHPSRVLAASASASGTKRSCRPQTSSVGTAIRRSSASATCFVQLAISRRIVRLTCGTVARERVYSLKAASQSPSRRRASSKSKNAHRSKRSAFRSDGRRSNLIAVISRPTGIR